MYVVLVVDDSSLERSLIGSLLSTNSGLKIEYAENGVEALSQIDQLKPDLVVTDLIMPKIDGLELVEAVRNQYPEIPVILMTAYGNEDIAAEALTRGAASFVPKSQQADRLMDTVERLLTRVEGDRERQRIASCVTELRCSYRLENDPALIAPLVDQVQQLMAGMMFTDATGRIRVGVALEEAILNAMCHGNLEMSGKEMTDARAEKDHDRLSQLMHQRCHEERFLNRKVIVEVHISPTGAKFVVQDQGAGFDTVWASSGDKSKHFEKGNNRGVTLIRAFMDHVSYNTCGNALTMIKHREHREPKVTTHSAV